MVEFKAVINDVKTGKSYQATVAGHHANSLIGKKMGMVVDGIFVNRVMRQAARRGRQGDATGERPRGNRPLPLRGARIGQRPKKTQSADAGARHRPPRSQGSTSRREEAAARGGRAETTGRKARSRPGEASHGLPEEPQATLGSHGGCLRIRGPEELELLDVAANPQRSPPKARLRISTRAQTSGSQKPRSRHERIVCHSMAQGIRRIRAGVTWSGCLPFLPNRRGARLSAAGTFRDTT